jgi:MEDS: MEthanogen/methylotroph, DcmR Sensory domain
MCDHRALLYGTDEEMVTTAGPYLAEGIERSEPVLAVLRSGNIELLREHLGADARRVEFADAAAWYSSPAAALDAYRAFATAKLEGGAQWLRILGEAVWVGGSESEVRHWTRYEALVNLVFFASPVTLLCLYHERPQQQEIATQARLTHPHMVESGGLVTCSEYAEPSGFVLDTG